jgi:hypothetical protein
MSEPEQAANALIGNIIDGFRAASMPAGEDCIRRAVEAAIAQDTFRVGEEVTCSHGCVTGVIIAIDGEDAQISWSLRGKSTAKLCDLDHLSGQSSP